jgi:diaminohydroxyphosphoribosylaminopyrimidine deaminase/5-amino-6-(5-phosphoribosylamino)uracil reductase
MLNAMIEGGATTAAWALQEKAVDRILVFYAPMILGGDGRVMIDRLGVKRVKQAIRIQDMQIRKSGPDALVSGYL